MRSGSCSSSCSSNNNNGRTWYSIYLPISVVYVGSPSSASSVVISILVSVSLPPSTLSHLVLTSYAQCVCLCAHCMFLSAMCVYVCVGVPLQTPITPPKPAPPVGDCRCNTEGGRARSQHGNDLRVRQSRWLLASSSPLHRQGASPHR